MDGINLIKYILIKVYKNIFNSFYQTLTLFKKINEKKAVFVISRSKTLEGNLKFVHNELKKQLHDVEIHFVFTENKMNFNLFKELIVISNTKYLILDDYYLPIYLIKPNNCMKIIQLWHAAGAFKKFGYSTIGTRFGPDNSYLKLIPIHSNYTHVYVSSHKIIPYYAEAFNMSQDNIHPLGIPRTDFFYNSKLMKEAVNKIYENYPVLKKENGINILIAPTYRAKGEYRESKFDLIFELKKILEYINKDVRIIYKAHPYESVKELESLEKNAKILIANKFSINEWMVIADAFITDYSSSIFEFCLLKKPFAHFVPDLEEYSRNRGFYQDIEKISDGAILKNSKELIEWINSRIKKEKFDTSRMIRYNFDNRDNVTEKIVRHFINS